jgi:hypothetical protein
MHKDSSTQSYNVKRTIHPSGVLGVLIFALSMSASAADFKKDLEITGVSHPLVDSNQNEAGSISFKKATFSYEFFTLLDSPCQLFGFDHEIERINLQGLFSIEPASHDKPMVPSLFEQDGGAVLTLSRADFARLKVYTFDYQLQFHASGNNHYICGRFPGYIQGQNKGSFDVPAGKKWAQWVMYDVSRREFVAADRAKVLFLMFDKQHENGWESTFIHLDNIQINRSELTSILCKYGKLDLLYPSKPQFIQYAPLLQNFSAGQVSRTVAEQQAAYQTLQEVAQRMSLPEEFTRQAAALNKTYYNEFISKKIPFNFGSDGYQDPVKMNQLIEYYGKKYKDELALSDINLGFALPMPISFTIQARVVEKPPKISAGIYLVSQSVDNLPSKERAAEIRRFEAQRKKEEEERERAHRRRVNAEADKYLQARTKTCPSFNTVLNFAQLKDRAALEKYLNSLYGTKVEELKKQFYLPELDYHNWEFTVKWNLPQ